MKRGMRARKDDGFTMIEMLIAASMMLIAAVAVMALMLVAFRQDDSQSDRLVALDSARNAILQMTSEIRGAAMLESTSPQVLDVLVHFPSDPGNPYHWVRYKCVGNDQGASAGLGGTCSRQDKDLYSGPDCDGTATGPGCTLILRNVVKYTGSQSFAEPCDNYDPASSEEKHFCTKDNRTVQFSVFVSVPGANNPIELRTATTVRNCMHQQQIVPCVSSTPS